jgi:serine/threonine protein kinase
VSPHPGRHIIQGVTSSEDQVVFIIGILSGFHLIKLFISYRSDFHQEVKILSRLKDPNIVHVLGVCSQGEPLAVVMEYMKYGDLHQFLLAHIPDSTLNHHKHANLLRYGMTFV